MAVPAHDERDFEFARKYGLSIKTSICPSPIDQRYDPLLECSDLNEEQLEVLDPDVFSYRKNPDIF